MNDDKWWYMYKIWLWYYGSQVPPYYGTAVPQLGMILNWAPVDPERQ